MINRGHSVPLGGGLLEEAWTGNEVNLTYLRIFGCTSYVHINSVDGTKLDAKSLKCTFIGYGVNDFGYRFWDAKNRKIIRSKDVIFNESVMYKDMIKQQRGNGEKTEYVELEEIPNKVAHTPHDENTEVDESAQPEPQTPFLKR